MNKGLNTRMMLAVMAGMAFRAAEPGVSGSGNAPAAPELTPEQKKKAAKAEADRVKAEQKQRDADAKAATKAADAQKKLDEKAAKDKAAEEAKAAKEAAKVASKQPEQNGVTRPKPETLCGKAWAVFDELSKKAGAPVAIADALAVTGPQGLNEGNVKAEYSRWRKFFGVSGRVVSPSVQKEKDAKAAEIAQKKADAEKAKADKAKAAADEKAKKEKEKADAKLAKDQAAAKAKEEKQRKAAEEAAAKAVASKTTAA